MMGILVFTTLYVALGSFAVSRAQDADGIVRASIFEISPERGALEGGTRLTIKGAGFSGAGLDGYVILWR